MLPENLIQLHEGEEFVREKSIEAITAAADLSLHVRAIESSMDLIDYFVRHYTREDDDQLTIQLLGIRLFNGTASALKLLLSGYYQTSAQIQRDLLETIFLLDYFKSDRTLISVWRSADKRVRTTQFAPVHVRTALDERDGFTERKRKAAYDLLSELAAHPSHMGFRMLTPIPGGDAHCGPFFEVTAMKAVLSELAKHLVQAAQVFTLFFDMRNRSDCAVKIIFMEAQGLWMEKFFNLPFDRASPDVMRGMLTKLPE